MGRVGLWIKAHPFMAVGLLVIAGLATAATVISYTTDSTVTTQTTPPPIQYVAGDDAGPAALSDYVSAYTISTNKTYFTSTIKGVPEATLTVDSYVKIDNVDDASHTVTLTTAQVSNGNVDAYSLAIYNANDVLQDTLDLTAATPSASFTIPADGDAAEPFYAKLTLTLASGTTDASLGGGLSNSIDLAVS